MSVLLVHEDREYLLAPGDRLETDLGVLDLPADVEPGDVVETHLGAEFAVRRLRGPDLFDHFERTGAPMMPRDVGLVVGRTGLQSGDRVLDAGTGTGVLAATVGRLGAEVTTYERDPEAAETARENLDLAGVSSSVTVRTGDLTEDLERVLEEGPFDVVTLDTGDAPALVARTPDLLAPGGFVAAYAPFVEQARATVEAAREAGLDGVVARETIQRDLDVGDRGTRPSTRGVGHTGYLTFGRNG